MITIITMLKAMAARVGAFFRKGEMDGDFAQELESHLGMLVEEPAYSSGGAVTR